MNIKLPKNTVNWLLPDDSKIESSVSHIPELLLLLKLVDTVSINTTMYRVLDTELLILDGEAAIVTVSLQ